VAEILEALWRSVLLRRDELSGWLGNMNKYSGGGDRAFWLEAYGGRSYTVERVKRPEPITVDRLTVGIIGTIQPDRLSTLLLNGDDDGLLARLAIVWPERAPLRRPTMSVDETVARRAFQRLHELQPAYDEDGKPRPHFVPFDDGAVELLYKFRECCRGFEDTSEGLMKSHIGKFPGLAVRLSVIFAYLDWAIGDVAAEPGRVTAAHLGRACHYVAEYLRPMAIRAYGDAAAPSEERAAIQLARMILDAHWTEFSIRDVVAKKRSGLRSSKEVNAATRVLIEAGWIRMETGPKPQRGPSRTVHAVNPAIYGENMP
jgi:hypothetical protein